MLYDNLRDIVKHTYSLGFLEVVKIEGENSETLLKSVAQDKSVVMYGTTKTELADFADSVTGFSRMAVLKGMLDFPLFADQEEATIEVKKQKRDNTEIPAEIYFKSSTGHTGAYRVMGKDAVEQQINVPSFKGASWDVTIEPTKRNLTDMSYFAGVLGSYEPTFSVVTSGSELEFHIGPGGGDYTVVPIATNITGSLTKTWNWPLTQVLAILRLSETSNCSMSFSDQGALKITVDSGLAYYEYILPARTK